MNIPYRLLTFLLLICSSSIYSQSFYFCDQNKDIHFFDFSTCQDSIVVDVQAAGIVYTDITFAPDGNLYATAVGLLYSIDQQAGLANLVYDWCPGFFCYTTSLTSDADGNIYAAGDSLYVYNIYTGLGANLGALPTGIFSAGDMTFFNGNLYLTTSNNELALIDVSNPGNSTVVFPYNTILPIVAINTFFISCDSSISIGANQFGQMYFIDIDNQTVIPAPCSVSGFQILGLATPDEYLSSDCTFTFDLDGDDSSGNSFDNFGYVICELPGPVVDTDLVLETGYFIDSVVIHDTPNSAGFPNNYFSAPSFPGITMLGAGTNHLVFVNEGAATDEDFANALKSVLMDNGTMPPDWGSITVSIEVWSQAAVDLFGGPTQGRVAAIWFVPPPAFSLGPDQILCPDDTVLLFSGANPGQWDYQYLWQDGSTSDTLAVSAPGAYVLTVETNYSAPTAFNCNWTDTVEVIGGQAMSGQSEVQLCAGDVFFLNGQMFTSDTTVCDTLVATNGCDSVHCHEVTFLPLPQHSFQASICEGSTFPFGGQELSQTGIYFDTIPAPGGCDSVLELSLSVLPLGFSAIDTLICEGESVTVGGLAFDSTGVYAVLLANANGCDSLVQLNMEVLPSSFASMVATICEGDSISVGGMFFSTTGEHQVTLPNWLGCDSTVNLALTVQPIVTISLDTAICQGQSLQFGGQEFSQAGIYQFVTSPPATCDTSFNLTLAVLPLPTASVSQASNGCAAISVQLEAMTDQPLASFTWSNAIVGPSITATAGGTYTVTVTAPNGCSATASAFAELAEPFTAEVHFQPPTCAGEVDGWIEILGTSGGIPPYLYVFNNALPTPDPVLEPIGRGNYSIVATDESGCTWDTTLTILEPPTFQVDAGADQSILIGETAMLAATANAAIDSAWWFPPSFLECPSCLQTTSSTSQDIEYQVFALNENGCIAADDIYIQVLSKSTGLVYAPNVFSPNGDGLNDLFTLFANKEVQSVESLQIFDRWGGLVFRTEKLTPNDLSQGWDGEWRGKPANTGAYTWFAVIKMMDGEDRLLEGEVMLIR